MVSSVQGSNGVTGGSATTATTGSQVSDMQDRFLKLLVTQMKNQDPLNPLDNAQVTSQMAQLSTVTGIEKLNATVQALSSSMMSAQSMQAAAMIGHAALVPGKQIDLMAGKSNAALELTQPADKVTVTISDASGQVVKTLQLGAQEMGIVDFQWDGTDDQGNALADGRYSFSAQAEQGGDKFTPSTMSYGMVGSVSLGASGAQLEMGSLGVFGLDAVRRIL